VVHLTQQQKSRDISRDAAAAAAAAAGTAKLEQRIVVVFPQKTPVYCPAIKIYVNRSIGRTCEFDLATLSVLPRRPRQLIGLLK